MGATSMRKALALAPGPVTLSDYDSSARPLMPAAAKGKAKRLRTDAAALADYQERLWAESSVGGRRSVLLVLQGMDTAGKGGVTEHVIGACGPIGVEYTAFKAPTPQELAHHFLWRIRHRLPAAGVIGVFDRSHYEDVLVVRVHGLVTDEEIERRFAAINAFEAKAVAGGMTIIKCFLHISYETQRKRLLARLEDPAKHWKFNPADITERERWPEYQQAYEDALERCNTSVAPWYVVPSDSKRYRNWAVAELLRETLTELDPQYPQPDLDVTRLSRRLRRD